MKTKFRLSHRIFSHTYDAKISCSLISHDTQPFAKELLITKSRKYVKLTARKIRTLGKPSTLVRADEVYHKPKAVKDFDEIRFNMFN